MKTIKNKEIIRLYQNRLAKQQIFSEEFIKKGQLKYELKGKRIISQNGKLETFYFLLSGSVQIKSVMSDGRLLMINVLSAPCMIGEMELLNKDYESQEVVVIKDAYLYAWNLDEAAEILLKDPLFLRELANNLALKEKRAIQALIRERSLDALKRLCLFIEENRIGNQFLIRKKDVADYLGISYRHTEKLFYDLIKKGVLKKEGLTYFIQDIRILHKLATN